MTGVMPDLSHADLIGEDFNHANFNGANLSGADLASANLHQATFVGAFLAGTRLNSAYLIGADMTDAFMNNSDLSGAHLTDVKLCGTELHGASFCGARFGRTVISNSDLSLVQGLREAIHIMPSPIGIDTLYLSCGNIPDEFLEGAGVPDEVITHVLPLIRAGNPIQFYSCFISYCGKDEEFARRLHQRMRAAGLRVWFAPEDLKGGDKLMDQLERAIQLHDRLLLVLSDQSIMSEWVMTEIRRAREAERKEKRRKLFPIRLAAFDVLSEWKCPDSKSGQDLAEEVRHYFIPDFSNWRKHDDFEKAFDRLLRDLRAEEAVNRV